MNILFTGASSKLGERVLGKILPSNDVERVWCGIHTVGVRLSDPKIREIRLDLETAPDLSAIDRIDLLVHFSGVTHARAASAYDEINRGGTLRLADAARRRGCRRMVYISTRCIGAGSGAYGKSKEAAEEGLRALPWESLLILRPAEIYGAGGKEGVDAFVSMAERLHVVPMLFGHPNISFAPLHADDFAAICAELILTPSEGVVCYTLSGPEALTGIGLALRVARRRWAVPIPVWIPALRAAASAVQALGLAPPFAPDQLDRLVGAKSAAPRPGSAVVPRRLLL